jgi:hypothetical protein
MLLSVFSSVLPALAECECPPDSVERSILEADQIFRGEIVLARISDDASHTIEFVVKVGDTIRGNPGKQYRLTTPAPGLCGVSVRLGFTDMFVLGPDKSEVSICNGSGRAPYMEYPLLDIAIKLVDMPVSDARGTQRLLTEEFYGEFERALLDDFFDLVEKIDPTGIKSVRSADRIEYRGIVVLFSDGVYESVQTL